MAAGWPDYWFDSFMVLSRLLLKDIQKFPSFLFQEFFFTLFYLYF